MSKKLGLATLAATFSSNSARAVEEYIPCLHPINLLCANFFSRATRMASNDMLDQYSINYRSSYAVPLMVALFEREFLWSDCYDSESVSGIRVSLQCIARVKISDGRAR